MNLSMNKFLLLDLTNHPILLPYEFLSKTGHSYPSGEFVHKIDTHRHDKNEPQRDHHEHEQIVQPAGIPDSDVHCLSLQI